jgi:diguanylate cyclase (GGDEF)-like protein
VSATLPEKFSDDLLAALKDVSSASFGTFQGTALEFSRYCNEQFESEVSLKGILRKLVVMLSSWVGVDRLSFISCDAALSEFSVSTHPLTFQGTKSFPEDMTTELKRTLNQPAVISQLDTSGLIRLNLKGEDIWCARFSDPKDNFGVLIWTSKEIDRLAPNVMISTGLPVGTDIMGFMIESAQQAARWLKRLHAAQSLLYEDDVTGLFNFRYLDVALDSEFRRLQRFHTPFSLLFIDLDNFKQVNDVYGHLTGSSILRQVGEQIKGALRDVDVVIRYGGDEFVVVLIGTNSKQALLAAERVRAQVDRFRFRAEGSSDPLHVSASIGVASCPEHAKDKQTVLRLADETMYAAKRGGKNRVVIVQTRGLQQSVSLTLPREK